MKAKRQIIVNITNGEFEINIFFIKILLKMRYIWDNYWKKNSFLDLLPNYSDPLRKLVFFESRKKNPLTLSINATIFGHNLIWQKNGVNIDKIKDLKDRYTITKNQLIIHRPMLSDDGNYTCIVPKLNVSANFEVIGKQNHME